MGSPVVLATAGVTVTIGPGMAGILMGVYSVVPLLPGPEVLSMEEVLLGSLVAAFFVGRTFLAAEVLGEMG